MPKIADEGGKNADSRSGTKTADNSDIDPLDDIPEPSDGDFVDSIGDEERKFYLQKFKDLKQVKHTRLHCTACDKHLGLLTRHINRYRMHPLLRTLVCISCQDFYNSGEFEKGEDGSELYCRWCGQGGQVYCCSSCPIVFCEKCIKRNFGVQKINEIESNDDWKCFVCNPNPLWVHRARYWVLIIYCNFKNDQAKNCTDSSQKVILLRKCQVDESDCCKRNTSGRQRHSLPAVVDAKKKIIPPVPEIKKVEPIKVTPDQKKALSISEARQAIKRLGSPVSIKKVTVPSSQVSGSPLLASPNVQPAPLKMPIPQLSINPMAQTMAMGGKRMRMNSPIMIQPLPPPLVPRFTGNQVTVARQEKKPRRSLQSSGMYNGYNPQAPYNTPNRDIYCNIINNDNLNLSLDSLTQGVDITPLPTMSSQNEEDAVVCTPDLPMDMEEVEEQQPTVRDDDVQCLTPTPTPTPKIVPKPLSALTEPKQQRQYPSVLPSTAFSNIIQMTENDVTINEVTGGLKFKVDPSTLSSSKMYKLPDGRIFAVNNNPNMPGGYSATIVAIDEASLARSGHPNVRSQRLQRIQRQTQVSKPAPPAPTPKLHSWTTPVISKKKSPVTTPRISSTAKILPPKPQFDTSAPAGSVEWFKFNVTDAIDIMNYVLQKLNRIKTSSQELRTKSIEDVKEMHTNFDQILKTSCKRFTEVRETLDQGYKNWLKEKNCPDVVSDDEDEVQILSSEIAPPRPKVNVVPKKSTINDEPIFIDENSNDSIRNVEDEGISVNNDKTEHSTAAPKDSEIETLEDSPVKSVDGGSRNIPENDSAKSQEEVGDGDKVTDSSKVDNTDDVSTTNIEERILPDAGIEVIESQHSPDQDREKEEEREKDTSNADDNSANADDNSANVDDSSANVDDISANVDDISANVDDNSANVDDNSANVDDNSANVDDNSANVDENSANVDENSANVDDNSANVDDNSANVDGDSTNVDDSSNNRNDNVDHNSSNVDHSSTNVDDSRNNVDENADHLASSTTIDDSSTHMDNNVGDEAIADDSNSNLESNIDNVKENVSNADDSINNEDTLSNGKLSPNKDEEASNNGETVSKAMDDSMSDDIMEKLLYDNNDAEPMDIGSGLEELEKFTEKSLSEIDQDGNNLNT